MFDRIKGGLRLLKTFKDCLCQMLKLLAAGLPPISEPTSALTCFSMTRFLFFYFFCTVENFEKNVFYRFSPTVSLLLFKSTLKQGFMTFLKNR